MRLEILTAMIAALSSAVPQDPAPPDAPPPATLSPENKGAKLKLWNGTTGSARASLSGKSLSIWWKWTNTGPEPKQFSLQEESVPFWPTEIVEGGVDRIVVAGKQRSSTILELWTFSRSPLPAPYLDSTTGQWVYPELGVAIESRKAIYADAVVGRDIVSALFYNPKPGAGVDTSLYVQFHDSKDVFRLDYMSDETTTLTKLYSPSDPAVILVPELTGEFDTVWGADHTSAGYVYVLGTSANTAAPPPIVLLIDADRNGDLDTVNVLSPGDWVGQGWNDGSNYAPFL